MREIKFRAWEEFGKYEIGSDGSVWHLNFRGSGNRRRMKSHTDFEGYERVVMLDGKNRYVRKVHRLVAISFLSKPSEKHEVNHRNGSRSDNKLENLEWVTSRENTLHGFRVNGRKISKQQRIAMREGTLAFNRRRWHPEQYAKAA